MRAFRGRYEKGEKDDMIPGIFLGMLNGGGGGVENCYGGVNMRKAQIYIIT